MAGTESGGRWREYCKNQQGGSMGGVEVKMKREMIIFGGHPLCDEYVFFMQRGGKAFVLSLIFFCVPAPLTSMYLFPTCIYRHVVLNRGYDK